MSSLKNDFFMYDFFMTDKHISYLDLIPKLFSLLPQLLQLTHPAWWFPSGVSSEELWGRGGPIFTGVLIYSKALTHNSLVLPDVKGATRVART